MSMLCNCGAKDFADAQRHSPQCASDLVRERCDWCSKLAMTRVEVKPGRVVKLNTNTHHGKVSKNLLPRTALACLDCAARVVVPVPMPVPITGDQLRIEGV